MKLFGSEKSPYVRRVRYLLHFLELPYEMVTFSIFEKEGRELLDQHSPTKKIPFLVDEDKTYVDSWLISEHLLKKAQERLFMPEQELTYINDANDSGVVLFLIKYNKLDLNWENPYCQTHLLRIRDILTYFEKLDLDLKSFQLRECWLYSMLEWFEAREVWDTKTSHPRLYQFLQECEVYKI